MLLGFMSLLLAMTQERISKICVSTKVAEIMLPCRKADGDNENGGKIPQRTNATDSCTKVYVLLFKSFSFCIC